MSGDDACVLVGEELSGAADAGLNFVEDQQEAVLVAKSAQGLKECAGNRPDAALALNRLNHQRCRIGSDRGLKRRNVAERHLIEPVDLGAETFEIFGLTARRERRERAAVERSLERHDPEAVRDCRWTRGTSAQS